MRLSDKTVVRKRRCKPSGCGFESGPCPCLYYLFSWAHALRPYVPGVTSTEANQLNSYTALEIWPTELLAGCMNLLAKRLVTSKYLMFGILGSIWMLIRSGIFSHRTIPVF